MAVGVNIWSNHHTLAFIPKNNPIAQEIKTRLQAIEPRLTSAHFIEFDSYNDMYQHYVATYFVSDCKSRIYSAIEFHPTEIFQNDDLTISGSSIKSTTHVSHSYTIHTPPSLLHTDHNVLLDLANSNPAVDFFHMYTTETAALFALVDKAYVYHNNVMQSPENFVFHEYLRLHPEIDIEQIQSQHEQSTHHFPSPSTLLHVAKQIPLPELRHLLNQHAQKYRLSLHPFPTSQFDDATIYETLCSLVPHLLFISFVVMTSILLSTMSSEYSLGMFSVLHTIGMNPAAWLLSWELTFMFLSLPIIGMIAYILQMYIYKTSSLYIIFIIVTLLYWYFMSLAAIFTTSRIKNEQFQHFRSVLFQFLILCSITTYFPSILTTSLNFIADIPALASIKASLISIIRPHEAIASVLFPFGVTPTFFYSILSLPHAVFNLLHIYRLSSSPGGTDAIADLLFSHPGFSSHHTLITLWVAIIAHILIDIPVFLRAAASLNLSVSISAAVTSHHPEKRPSPFFESPTASERENIAVSLSALNKTYQTPRGALSAVKNVSFNLYRGTILSFLGANGAGKSTVINMIAGVLSPSSGSISFSTDASNPTIRPRLGFCSQSNTIYPFMSPLDHLRIVSSLRYAIMREQPQHSGQILPPQLNDEDLYRSAARLHLVTPVSPTTSSVSSSASLAESRQYMHRPMSALSGGQVRKTMIAMALLYEPSCCILDEPTGGVDINAQRHIWDELLRVRQETSCSILMSTHTFDEAEIGDKIAIMSNASLVCYGSSLFLRKVWGVGYTLSLRLSQAVIEQSLQQRRAEDIRTALLCTLASSESSSTNDLQRTDSSATTTAATSAILSQPVFTQENTFQFSIPLEHNKSIIAILRYLEQHEAKWDIVAKHFTVTTLRDVFFKASSGEQVPSLASSLTTAESVVVDSKQTSPTVQSAVVAPPVSLAPTPATLYRKKNRFCAQARMIYARRLAIARHDIWQSLFTCVFPVIILGIAVLVALSMLSSRTIALDSEVFNSFTFPITRGINPHADALALLVQNKMGPGPAFFPSTITTNTSIPHDLRGIMETYAPHFTHSDAQQQTAVRYGALICTDFDTAVSHDNDDVQHAAMTDSDYPIQSLRTLLYANTTSPYAHLALFSRFSSALINFGDALRTDLSIGDKIEQSIYTNQHSNNLSDTTANNQLLSSQTTQNTLSTFIPVKQSIHGHIHSLSQLQLYTVSRYLALFASILGLAIQIPIVLHFLMAETSGQTNILTHLQLSGLYSSSYWFGNLLFDMSMSLISVCSMVFLLYALGLSIVPSYAMFIALFLFSLNSILFTYITAITAINQEISQYLLTSFMTLSHFAFFGIGFIVVFVKGYNIMWLALGAVSPPYLTILTLFSFEDRLSPFLPSNWYFIIAQCGQAVILAIILSCIQLVHTRRRSLVDIISSLFCCSLSSRSKTQPIDANLQLNNTSTTDASAMIRQDILETKPQCYPEQFPIVVSGLHKNYGPFTALHDLYFSVKRGNVFALLGPNSAGKSTTLQLLTGHVMPTSGPLDSSPQTSPQSPYTAFINGFDIATQWVDCLAAGNVIGYCPQYNPINVSLTAYQQVEIYAILRNVSLTTMDITIKWLLTSLGFTNNMIYRPMHYLSGGQRRRVTYACALIGTPSLLLLDEPTNAIDIISKQLMYHVLEFFQQYQSTILTSHSLEEVELLAQDIAILVKGNIVAIGDKTQLKQQLGRGYTIICACPENQEELLIETFRFVFTNYNSKIQITIKDCRNGNVSLHILPPNNNDDVTTTLLSIVDMFEIIDSKVITSYCHQIHLDDISAVTYTIAETTLESIFLDLVQQFQ